MGALKSFVWSLQTALSSSGFSRVERTRFSIPLDGGNQLLVGLGFSTDPEPAVWVTYAVFHREIEDFLSELTSRNALFGVGGPTVISTLGYLTGQPGLAKMPIGSDDERRNAEEVVISATMDAAIPFSRHFSQYQEIIRLSRISLSPFHQFAKRVVSCVPSFYYPYYGTSFCGNYPIVRIAASLAMDGDFDAARSCISRAISTYSSNTGSLTEVSLRDLHSAIVRLSVR